MHLFVYWTLLFDEIVEKICGKIFKSIKWNLLWYKRYSVKGQMYPAIVMCNDCVVEGRILFDVDDESLKKIDEFEWDEYRKEIVRVKSGLWDLQCLVYIWNKDISLLEGDWNIEEFKQKYLRYYLEVKLEKLKNV